MARSFATTALKRRPKQSKISGWRQSNKLPRQSGNPNIRPTHSETTAEQHRLHARGKVLHNGYQKLLLNDSPAPLEYVRLKLEYMPEAIIKQYGLREKTTPKGAVYVAIKRGMYGLLQAGFLAQELLEKRLNAEG